MWGIRGIAQEHMKNLCIFYLLFFRSMGKMT